MSAPPSGRSSGIWLKRRLPAVARIARDGGWIDVGEGRVALDRRPVLSRLVATLARARERSPGRAVPAEELIAEVWPGEKIIPSAARNRLHVALNRARELGLREAIRSDDHGWMLDPELPIDVVAA